ncbi:MAG: A24 family peptidase [Mariniblastus sp.]|nr:A24 family peptidase [Mariniblastus sp.]
MIDPDVINSLTNPLLQILVLALIGGLLGTFINWATLQWGYQKWAYSPWSRPAPGTTPRQLADYLPVFGWLWIRRDSEIHGRTFWIRPFLVELAWVIGLPCFYLWEMQGGLVGFTVVPEPAWGEIWFWGHSILIVLMCIATLIDLDQRLIPDWITIPGAIIGLAIASLFPTFRLPVMASQGASLESLTFMSPDPVSTWQASSTGCLVGLLIFSIWAFALYPKLIPRQWHLRSWMLTAASMVRFWKRKPLKVHRYLRQQAITITVIWLTGIVLMPIAWHWLPGNIDSLFGALVGMGFAGMLVWLIRIIGSHALGQEAMGFGDVTLMAMIGAFLGWQASLLVFAFAPFAGLIVTAANFILTRDNELAFGPYLCLSALGILLFWPLIWGWAATSIFAVGPVFLFTVLVVALVLFAGMLFVIRLGKEKASSPVKED